MSVITLGELRVGAERSARRDEVHETIDALLHRIPAMGLTEEVARHYGQIRAHLAASGQIIGSNDLWIGAHALALDVTLVTSNIREFARIPDLRVEDWAAPDVP
jgi:tRNA(fMet)-specific endonuclease VapC